MQTWRDYLFFASHLEIPFQGDAKRSAFESRMQNVQYMQDKTRQL